MKRYKYHPPSIHDAKRRCQQLRVDHVVLGSALVAESKEPLYPNWEWPSDFDHFCFNVGYSCD